jgi:GTP-binding protein Era
MTAFRSGVVAVVGRPNVGKSTLVNALVGQKVAIVSDKPQTTRRGIHAIWSSEGAQVVLTDTPGYHKPRTLLGARLNELVGDAVSGVDVVLHVVDADAGVGTGDAFVYEHRVRPTGARAICVVNKVDATFGRSEVPQLAAAGALGEYDEIVPVSARQGKGVGMLRRLVALADAGRVAHGACCRLRVEALRVALDDDVGRGVDPLLEEVVVGEQRLGRPPVTAERRHQ